MQFGYRIIGDMGHRPLFLRKRPEQRPLLRLFIPDRYSIALEEWVRLVQTAQF